MKIIAFVEAHQADVIHKILEHCGLWRDPPPRAPPRPMRSFAKMAYSRGSTDEVDLDFLEHLRREAIDQA